MKPKCKMMLAFVVGAALALPTVRGLHAQAKPKAYTVIEVEVIDEAALKAHLPPVEAALAASSITSTSMTV